MTSQSQPGQGSFWRIQGEMAGRICFNIQYIVFNIQYSDKSKVRWLENTCFDIQYLIFHIQYSDKYKVRWLENICFDILPNFCFLSIWDKIPKVGTRLKCGWSCHSLLFVSSHFFSWPGSTLSWTRRHRPSSWESEIFRRRMAPPTSARYCRL